MLETEITTVPSMAEDAIALSQSAVSSNTREAYEGDVDRFNVWCAERNYRSLPADPDAIAHYITHMYRIDHKKPATIRRALVAIRKKHSSFGLPNPISDFTRLIEKGIRRQAGIAQTRVEPITVDRLRRIIDHCAADFIGYRDQALILLGWAAALRRSEVVALDVADISDCDEGIVVNLRRSKTDQEGQGRSIAVPFVDADRLCAIRALRQWLRISGIKSGPIFRTVGPGGHKSIYAALDTRLTAKTVSNVVKSAVTRAGYNPALYSGHSLRSGFVTAAATAGAQAIDIRRITGHRSDQQLAVYVREGRQFVNHPLDAIFVRENLSTENLSTEINSRLGPNLIDPTDQS